MSGFGQLVLLEAESFKTRVCAAQGRTGEMLLLVMCWVRKAIKTILDFVWNSKVILNRYDEGKLALFVTCWACDAFK